VPASTLLIALRGVDKPDIALDRFPSTNWSGNIKVKSACSASSMSAEDKAC
jgi:hypothetical protein